MFSHDSGSAVAFLIGVAVAFLIGVYQVIANTKRLLSAKTKNLKQVDLYYSCSESEWVVGEAANWVAAALAWAWRSG